MTSPKTLQEIRDSAHSKRKPAFSIDGLSDFDALKVILANTSVNGSCLEWLGSRHVSVRNGKELPPRPKITYKGKRWQGYRLVLALVTGENPKDKGACHRCGNSICMNPKHLYWGSAKENCMDTVSHGRHAQKNKEFCKHGHPLTEDNIIFHKRKRRCRTCNSIETKRSYDKKQNSIKEMQNLLKARNAEIERLKTEIEKFDPIAYSEAEQAIRARDAEIAGYKEINSIQKTYLEAAENADKRAHAILTELESALAKIADPRKRDHKEPDLYTERGCMMNMAEDALAKLKEWRTK